MYTNKCTAGGGTMFDADVVVKDEDDGDTEILFSSLLVPSSSVA